LLSFNTILILSEAKSAAGQKQKEGHKYRFHKNERVFEL
jgi:hypothetical protein